MQYFFQIKSGNRCAHSPKLQIRMMACYTHNSSNSTRSLCRTRQYRHIFRRTQNKIQCRVFQSCGLQLPTFLSEGQRWDSHYEFRCSCSDIDSQGILNGNTINCEEVHVGQKRAHRSINSSTAPAQPRLAVEAISSEENPKSTDDV